MPQKMTSEERAAYQREYRAKKKTQPVEPLTDKERGLPRSNYFSEHGAPGGWGETIRNMEPALVQRILDHPAIRTKR